MSRGSFLGQLTGWGRAAANLFRTQVLDLRCTSVVAGKALNLPGLILRNADEAEIAFTLSCSMLSFGALGRFASTLQIRLGRSEGSPAVVLRKSRKPASFLGPLNPQPSTLNPQPLAGWQIKKAAAWRKSHVLIRLSRQLLANRASLQLEIRPWGKLWRTLQFRLVDEPEAQQLRLAQLTAQAQQLWIQSGGQRYLGNVVAEPTACLVPEFTLPASELDAVLPPCEAAVSLALLAGESRTPLSNTFITVGKGPVRFRSSPLAIQDCPPLRQPGQYRLVASLGARELASFAFRITDRREWQAQLKVRVLVDGETLDGRLRRETGALRWASHVAFYPSLRIETTIPAPNTWIRGRACILLGQRVLRCEELLLRLSGNATRLRLQRFSLLELRPQCWARNVHLLLTLELDGSPRASRPVIILPGSGLTNFEGQLSLDPSHLPLDEVAYEGILHSLALSKPSRG